MSPRRRRLSTLARALFRRTLQIGVFLFIVYAAMGSAWRNYKVAHNNARLVALIEGDTWGKIYALNESLLELWGESYEASLDFLGMTWAATFFGIETADPIMVLSHALSVGPPRTSLIVSALIALGMAVLLGKVFCSHICPMRTLFELGQLIRGGFLYLGFPLPHMRSSMRLGGWVLLGGLLAGIGAGTAVWFLILPYLSVSAAIFLAITSGSTASLLAIPLGWWVTDMLMAPRLLLSQCLPAGFLAGAVRSFFLLGATQVEENALPRELPRL